MWIDKEKYLERMKDEKWTPGWDAIRRAFAAVYGRHGKYLPASRVPSMCSGLEGFGVYASPNGYTHIVTRGLSQIHPHPDARGNKSSGWGLELTIKWPNANPSIARAIHILDKLAERIDVNKDGWVMLFPPCCKVDNAPEELLGEPGGALGIVPDTEIPAIDTIHGEVQFRQVISISAQDNAYIARHQNSMAQVLYRLAQEDANLPFRPIA